MDFDAYIDNIGEPSEPEQPGQQPNKLPD
jgi:hypothetical protein